MPAIKKKDTIGIRKLCNLYDRHAPLILEDAGYIYDIENERGPRQFKVLRDLPDKEKYTALRDDKYRQSLNEALTEAYGEFSSLRDEVQDWYDNLPESFQNGSKGDDLQETINQLESFCDNEPSFKDKMQEFMDDTTAVFLPPAQNKSRADRCATNTVILGTVHDKLCDDKELRKQIIELGIKDEIKELIDQLETDKMEAENVSFPGMY